MSAGTAVLVLDSGSLGWGSSDSGESPLRAVNVVEKNRVGLGAICSDRVDGRKDLKNREGDLEESGCN